MPGCTAFPLRLCAFALCAAAVPEAEAGPITRTEVIEIAEQFATFRWTASAGNIRHGRDEDGVEVHTPDFAGGRGSPESACWRAGAENVGVAYKWGGFDSLERFAAGVRNGKAAGDVYTAEKRRLGGRGVSGDAVGIDCSGFISRCWKLSRKQSTSTLAGICTRLRSAEELLPGDILNQPGGHVVLFARWLDGDKRRASFYEAAPYSKVLASDYDVGTLVASGFQPMRYRQIATAR